MVTITFSESVTGFGSDDIAITNGYLGSLSGSETVYTANVVANTDGTVTVDVAAGAASDAAGNGSEAAAQFSRTYDKTPPGVPSVTSVSSLTNDDADVDVDRGRRKPVLPVQTGRFRRNIWCHYHYHY